MTEQYDRLRKMHLLFGRQISGYHDRLFKAYPSSVGYSSHNLSEEEFFGVLTLALSLAGNFGGEGHKKVYFLTPATFEQWVTTEFKSSAQHILGHLKDRKNVPAIRHVGKLFHQVMLGSQVWQLPSEPERWVAFGFDRTDAIPEWMRPKLLDLLGGV